AYENSLIYKERTKKLHDDKIKNRIFNVGDQVLLFNSRLKIFSNSSTIMEETHHRWRFRMLPLSLRTTEYRDRVDPTTRIILQRLKTSCVGYCPGFQDLQRTKKLHDEKIKNHIFNVGDQVLLFNSRLKIFSGKLKSRWSSPFKISEIYPYGTAKLIHSDGCNFKVNCHRLKHYHGGDPPPLEISNVTTFPKDN
nr:reverse transcriptase domain-containing protein [Tanacetum cinerariifolium]